MEGQERPNTVFKKEKTPQTTNQRQISKTTQSFGLALPSQKSVGSKVSKSRTVSWESSVENLPQ